MIKMKTKLNPHWYLLAGIVFSTASHMIFSINLLGWIAYTPFLIWLYKTEGFRSRLKFFAALVIAWSLITAKIISSPMSYLFVFMFSIPIALIHLPAFLLWARFKDKTLSILLFPAVMSLFEWLQYTYTPFASWGVSAYTQVDTLPIAQSVSLFGMPGLSFMIMWVNVALAVIIVKRKLTKVNFYLPAAILTSLIIYGNIRINSYDSKGRETILTAAVCTDSDVNGLPLPSKEKNASVKNALFERTKKAASFGAKLIVWNEAATYVLPEDENNWKDKLKDLCSENNCNLVASYVVPVQTNPLLYNNKYVLVDSSGTIQYEYLKHEPVPGEPAKRGKENLQITEINGIKIGSVICYDYNFPYLAKTWGKLNADIVAVPSSDWRGIDPLHSKMAAYRAIEQGHSILRSTRFGLSAGILPTGEMIARMSSFDKNSKIMTAQLPVHSVKTLYSVIGDSFVYLLIGFILFFFVTINLPKKDSKHNVN